MPHTLSEKDKFLQVYNLKQFISLLVCRILCLRLSIFLVVSLAFNGWDIFVAHKVSLEKGNKNQGLNTSEIWNLRSNDRHLESSLLIITLSPHAITNDKS